MRLFGLILISVFIQTVSTTLVIGEQSFEVYDLMDNILLDHTLNSTIVLVDKKICSAQDLIDLPLNSNTSVIYFYPGTCHWLESANVFDQVALSSIIIAVGNGFFNAFYSSASNVSKKLPRPI